MGNSPRPNRAAGEKASEVNIDTNPPLPTSSVRSEIEGFGRELPARPASPTHPSSSSSSSVDDRTELQKFIQDIGDNEKDNSRLSKILQEIESDEIYKLSHYAGDNSALHMAVERGMLWAVKQLLDYKPNDKVMLSQVDSYWRQPLHIACLYGHKAIADLLLRHGADIEATELTGATALNEACREGHKAIVELLLSESYNANTRVVDIFGWSPIRTAVESDRDEIIGILLEKNSANINKADKNQETPLHAASRRLFYRCVKRLCHKGADCNLQAEGNNTALQYALEPTGDASEGRKYDVVVELLKHNADPGIQNAKGETALHLAARSGNFGIYKAIKVKMGDGQRSLQDQEGDTALNSALKTHPADIIKWMTDKETATEFDSEDEMEALLWAAQRQENHCHAESILKYLKDIRHPNKAPPEGSDTWSAIQWAAHLEMPSVLWLLLATSDPTKVRVPHRAAWDEAERQFEMKSGFKNNKPAQGKAQAGLKGKGKTSRHQSEAEREAERAETEKQEDPRTVDKQKPRSSRQQAKDLVLAILRDPPPTVTSGEEEKLTQPKASVDREEFLQEWVSKAAVIECFGGKDKSALFTQFRSVQDVIYGTGPTKITKEPAQTLARIKKLNGSPIYQRICKQQEDRLGDSLFTWVNLPATNDVLKRILLDDSACLSDEQSKDGLPSKGKRDPSHIPHNIQEKKSMRAPEVNSFFKASWSQIPDRTSESRIMKPRHTTNLTPGRKPQSKTSGSSADSSDRSLHAIYIPYLTLSIQCRSQDLGKSGHGWDSQQTKTDEEQMKTEKGQQKGGKEDEEEDKLRQALKEYHRLLQFYKGEVSFYHFSRTQREQHKGEENDQEHTAQQHERERRNQSQVVTRHIHKEGLAEKSHWTLVRVNQLWVWIIGSKWLITATTHPIDQFEDPFLTNVLRHIKEQAIAEGREVGPRTPLEMAKTIVQYCIDSYDRQSSPEVYGTDGSIRQIFSDSINKIARNDVRLFEGFCESMKSKPSKEQDKAHGWEDGAPKEQREVLHKGATVERNKRIKKAINDAAILSSEIRDIRDELQMLQAIAKHQADVQRKLQKDSFVDTTAWIQDMIKTTDRIKSNVEMTLSLEQSQVANDQAKESFQQGKNLTIFTAISSFFLPSSFLASLFALDVESFHKAPYWVLLIICKPYLFKYFPW
ncbi:unnamed protein product [Clonostachys byssicola]|uniref:Ankyrin repeat protein n=1 Tax=Clonostachys byssicola TaxID=160290 RepID=A0A9N9UJT9_9HYPO|nr:unnamed protein product [Clonostachys byssicola]